ncbi:hypothetical protein KKE19_03745 [Patescibacteria group bacterium]|nr:hypothetical protein [Patescibacteria group bacterium]MBU4367361.1 hypothetical protein [Patescibacteria group bacterium]MBU4461980.1 hypothetical protein [Patescibacteria group bacterium]MCG2699661.1 hypothetical protein [Candidatus Parcubacteria bacterium]
MADYYSDIKELINLIKSPGIQEELLPAKIVLIFFSIVFFVAVVYLMFTSSYLKYQFVVDLRSFFDWQPAGVQKIIRRWKKIQKRIATGSESEYKLAVIEADDLFRGVLEEKGFKGKTFEEIIGQVEKIAMPNMDEVLEAHKIRNSIVYDPNYKLDSDRAKQLLDIYERGIKNVESF